MTLRYIPPILESKKSAGEYLLFDDVRILDMINSYFINTRFNIKHNEFIKSFKFTYKNLYRGEEIITNIGILFEEIIIHINKVKIRTCDLITLENLYILFDIQDKHSFKNFLNELKIFDIELEAITENTVVCSWTKLGTIIDNHNFNDDYIKKVTRYIYREYNKLFDDYVRRYLMGHGLYRSLYPNHQ